MSVTDAARRSFARAYEAAPSPEAAVAIVTSWKRNGFGGVAPAPEVLTAAWLAQGGRDPRREPQVGDEVETWRGTFPFRRRQVWRVGKIQPPADWPRSLNEPMPKVMGRSIMVRDIGFFSERGPTHMRADALRVSSWRKAAKTATVLKVVCDACEGEGSIRPRLAVTLSEVQRRLLREPAEAVIEASQVEAVSTACDKCGGTGRGVV